MFLLLLKHRRKITLSNIILHRKNDIFKIIAQKLNIGHDVFTFFFIEIRKRCIEKLHLKEKFPRSCLHLHLPAGDSGQDS